MSENFKVVKIVSDSEIVVNAGSDHSINRGQSLEIFDPGDEVLDPETGQSLGTLDFIKTYLKVKHVYSKMCVCENAETIQLNPFNNSLLAVAAQGLFTVSTKAKRLNVDPTEISGGLSDSRKINIGDLVRKSKS